MRSAIILVAIIFFSAAAFPAIIYVPDHFTEIQGAIDASANGDTVIVRSGTYVENIDFKGKAITVMSESGPSVTVIDGGNPANPDFGSVACFQSGEGLDSVLEGFTLTNGSGTFAFSDMMGGGIYCSWSSPTIRGNWIQGNAAASGGGMYVYSSSAVIASNTVSGNISISYAGGGIAIYRDSLCTVTGNMIGNNTSYQSSGGIFVYESSPIIEHNTIFGNNASFAGGLQCSLGSAATVVENSIIDNTADSYGGGLYLIESDSLVSGNLIDGNQCKNGGGGIWISVNDSSTVTSNLINNNSVLTSGGWGGGGIGVIESTPTIANNILSGNSSAHLGGAISLGNSADVLIVNTSIHGNDAVEGGGIRCFSSAPTIWNSILWNNQAQYGPEIFISSTNYPSTLTIGYSDVKGGQYSIYVDPGCIIDWGPGMIDADPLFADAAKEDFHLTWDSPCRDTGDNSYVTELYDFEVDPRIHGGTVDMGADEFHTHLYHVGSVIPGSPIEVKVVGDPGVSPIMLALGSGLQDPPQSTPYGDLHLILPPAKTFNLGGIPNNGVRAYSAKVPMIWQSGGQYPFQALLGPIGNPNSVLTNLMVLAVE